MLRLARSNLRVEVSSVGLTAVGAPVTLLCPAALAADYEKAVLEKKPIAYWRLGDVKGPEVMDRSGHGHKGTCHGAPIFQEKGALKGDKNTAVKLDGKKSYIEISNHKDFSQPTSGKGLTVEVWVRPDVLDFEGETDSPHIHWLGKGGPKQQEWALHSTAERPRTDPIASRLTSSIPRADSAPAPISRTN